MFLKSLELTNLLSFRETKVELRDLNVIIGANGVGKSNLIEVIGLLRSLPESLNAPGGGISEWLWQGQPQATEARIGVGFCESSFRTGVRAEVRSNGARPNAHFENSQPGFSSGSESVRLGQNLQRVPDGTARRHSYWISD